MEYLQVKVIVIPIERGLLRKVKVIRATKWTPIELTKK